MWERVLHMWLHRRDQPFELAAFPSNGSVTPVYSRQVFLMNHRQSMYAPIPALGALPWAVEWGHVSTLVRVRLLFGVFFSLLQISVSLGSGQWRVSRQLRPWISRNLTIIQDLHQWGWTNFGLVQTTEPPGHKHLVVDVVVAGSVQRGRGGDRHNQRHS